MEQYIPKSAVVSEIDKLKGKVDDGSSYCNGWQHALRMLEIEINTLEVKEVDLIIHTIIAECCDWLVMNTNLGHDEIEGCRNLMLTVKDEQLKAQKEKEV